MGMIFYTVTIFLLMTLPILMKGRPMTDDEINSGLIFLSIGLGSTILFIFSNIIFKNQEINYGVE